MSDNTYEGLQPSRAPAALTIILKKIRPDYLTCAGLFFTMLLFIPLIANLDFHLRGTAVDINYRSPACVTAVACSLCICIPLVIEIALDTIYVPKPFQAYLFLRALSVFMLVFYCLVYLSTIHHENFAAILEVADDSQFLIEATTSLLFMKTLDTHRVWTQNIRTSLLLATLFSLYYVQYARNISGSSNDTAPFPILEPILLYAFFIGGFISTLQWIYRLIIDLRESQLPLRLSSLSFNDYYIIVLITNWFLFGIASTVSAHVVAYSSVEHRVAMTIIRTVFTFVIAFIPGLMIRRQSLQYYLNSETEHLDRENRRLEDMLRMKRIFVRHVSHEVR
jgi:hypothetical protein